MSADFGDAHNRHWEDAETLFKQDRLANADHLYGIAAECGLKRLMEKFGMQTRPVDGAPAVGGDRSHVDQMWPRYEAYRSGRHRGAGYQLSSENPFSNWNVGQRYENQSNFTRIVVSGHRRGAASVRRLIYKALKEGLI